MFIESIFSGSNSLVNYYYREKNVNLMIKVY